MLDLDFVLITVIALGATTVVVLRAPEGYEDETGFHFADSWLND